MVFIIIDSFNKEWQWPKALRFPNAPHSRYGDLVLLVMLVGRNAQR